MKIVTMTLFGIVAFAGALQAGIDFSTSYFTNNWLISFNNTSSQQANVEIILADPESVSDFKEVTAPSGTLIKDNLKFAIAPQSQRSAITNAPIDKIKITINGKSKTLTPADTTSVWGTPRYIAAPKTITISGVTGNTVNTAISNDVTVYSPFN